MNIRTVACGSQGLNEIGISCDYSCLSETNKQIVDEYLARKQQDPIRPCSHNGYETRFRISAVVDDEQDTITSAEEKLYKEVLSLGLVKQDVMYGYKTRSEAIQEIIEMTARKTQHWNGKDFDTIITPTIDEQETEEYLLETGRIIDNDTVWISNELKTKHENYIKEQTALKENSKFSKIYPSCLVGLF